MKHRPLTDDKPNGVHVIIRTLSASAASFFFPHSFLRRFYTNSYFFFLTNDIIIIISGFGVWLLKDARHEFVPVSSFFFRYLPFLLRVLWIIIIIITTTTTWTVRYVYHSEMNARNIIILYTLLYRQLLWSNLAQLFKANRRYSTRYRI